MGWGTLKQTTQRGQPDDLPFLRRSAALRSQRQRLGRDGELRLLPPRHADRSARGGGRWQRRQDRLRHQGQRTRSDCGRDADARCRGFARRLEDHRYPDLRRQDRRGLPAARRHFELERLGRPWQREGGFEALHRAERKSVGLAALRARDPQSRGSARCAAGRHARADQGRAADPQGRSRRTRGHTLRSDRARSQPDDHAAGRCQPPDRATVCERRHGPHRLRGRECASAQACGRLAKRAVGGPPA